MRRPLLRPGSCPPPTGRQQPGLCVAGLVRSVDGGRRLQLTSRPSVQLCATATGKQFTHIIWRPSSAGCLQGSPCLSIRACMHPWRRAFTTQINLRPVSSGLLANPNAASARVRALGIAPVAAQQGRASGHQRARDGQVHVDGERGGGDTGGHHRRREPRRAPHVPQRLAAAGRASLQVG